MADAFREMSVDYITESYKIVNPSDFQLSSPDGIVRYERGSDEALVAVGGHPEEKSIIIGQKGTMEHETLTPSSLNWSY